MNLNKNLSIRELILIGILIIAAAYYFVVQGPIARETEELEAEKSTLQTTIAYQTSRLAQQQAMQAEVDEVIDRSSGNPDVLPDYNNLNNIILELNTLLANSSSFNVSFGTDTNTDGIVRRAISVKYETTDYDEAVSILDEIESSPNRYKVGNVSITRQAYYSGTGFAWIVDDDDQGYEYTYAVSCSITSFEYAGN